MIDRTPWAPRSCIVSAGCIYNPMALVSKQTVKQFLGIALADPTYDAAFDQWISEAGTVIATACRQPIESTTKTAHRFSGNGRDTWTLPFFPVTAASALQERQSIDGDWTTVDTDTWEFVNVEGYYLHYPTGFAKGRGNYRVTFTHGYTATPDDIEQVAREMVAHVFQQSPSAGGDARFGVSGITKSKEGTSITTAFLDLNPSWRQKLEPYRRIIAVPAR